MRAAGLEYVVRVSVVLCSILVRLFVMCVPEECFSCCQSWCHSVSQGDGGWPEWDLSSLLYFQG